MHRGTPFLTLLLFVLVSAPLAAADDAKDFFFHKGDGIVFLGDSITVPAQDATVQVAEDAIAMRRHDSPVAEPAGMASYQ